MLDMAGPALTSLPSDVRKRFEEEKARLAAAKANPPTAPAAPEASRLEKRQELGSILKQFARDEVKVDPEQMVKIGADIGVSRGQLSGLYKKYRSEFEAEAPEGSAPALAKAVQQPAESMSQPLTGAPQQPAYQAPSVTPNMDAYAQSNFGEGLGRGRSLESESGKAMRIARKLQRQGFVSAAQGMALAGAEAKMLEPSIKTEEYLKQQDTLKTATQLEEQKTLADQKRALELQNKLIEARNRQALAELNSGKGLNPMTASLFGI